MSVVPYDRVMVNEKLFQKSSCFVLPCTDCKYIQCHYQLKIKYKKKIWVTSKPPCSNIFIIFIENSDILISLKLFTYIVENFSYKNMNLRNICN